MRTETALLSTVMGHDSTHEAWPFYYDCEQQTLLCQIRAAWGQDCVIQIGGGRLRIFAEDGRLESFSCSALSDAIAGKAPSKTDPRHNKMRIRPRLTGKTARRDVCLVRKSV
jgi:hypothetical protein